VEGAVSQKIAISVGGINEKEGKDLRGTALYWLLGRELGGLEKWEKPAFFFPGNGTGADFCRRVRSEGLVLAVNILYLDEREAVGRFRESK